MAHKNRPEVSAPTDDGNEISTDQHSRLHFSKLILLTQQIRGWLCVMQAGGSSYYLQRPVWFVETIWNYVKLLTYGFVWK